MTPTGSRRLSISERELIRTARNHPDDSLIHGQLRMALGRRGLTIFPDRPLSDLADLLETDAGETA